MYLFFLAISANAIDPDSKELGRAKKYCLRAKKKKKNTGSKLIKMAFGDISSSMYVT